MYLHEYQSKQCFARFGIPTMQGTTATTQQEARAIAAEIGAPVVVNAQALANQRIFRLAHTPSEAEHIARDILAMTIQGVRVRTILVEPAAEVAAEFLLGMYADRGGNLLLIASSKGGGDIEQIEQTHPELLLRETINPFLGVLEFQARNLASGINLPREQWNTFTRIAQNLFRCCAACDAVRAEINPLALTRDGNLTALGGKLVIDDNALFRQRELAAMRDPKAEHESTVRAREAGIAYVRLNGSVGCIVSGAGLGMSTMDMLALHGVGAASLIDMGSDINQVRINAGLGLILPDAKAVVFNLFADKASCTEIAGEIQAALAVTQPSVPVVLRLSGQEADRGNALLAAAEHPHLTLATTTREAARLATAAVRGFTDVRFGG